ncbi:hypothetical protein BRC90_06530 [Halobacteriales archaeon QS_4_69_34]|nr:MAG: hypothetical protein BRC90_06530 [Halobacteriales archaeon QS_4_69_34]
MNKNESGPDFLEAIEKQKEKSELERACELHEFEADAELTDAGHRSRFLALKIKSLGTKRDAGYSLDAKLLEKLLIARGVPEQKAEINAFQTLLKMQAMASDDALTVVNRTGEPDILFVRSEAIKKYELASGRESLQEQGRLDGFGSGERATVKAD